ncbi:uncharacterized protein CLUP02_16414 [Colletotrichum lupini]|uniref:Uncharacterized protein n=1 Tax=Colletotrichum lupini TaxID=145971 RepID=A0A9Q8T833_9PEZI|nr:uncharacterized protein CLUP02_16414 [Colletotrichum lupini]UQC90882.1 hypothetical protein CLUP02_16414 [Colletotrichum lupini]
MWCQEGGSAKKYTSLDGGKVTTGVSRCILYWECCYSVCGLACPSLLEGVPPLRSYLPLHMEPWLALSSSPKGGKIHPGPVWGNFPFHTVLTPFPAKSFKFIPLEQTIIVAFPPRVRSLETLSNFIPQLTTDTPNIWAGVLLGTGPESGRERDDWIAHARSYQIQRIPLAPQAHRRRYLNFDSSVSILRTEHAVRICFICFDIVFLRRCGTDSYSAPYECCVGTPRTLYKVTPIIWPWVLHSYPQEPTILEAERQLDSRRPAAIEQPDWLALADTVSRLTDKQLESSMNLGLASSEPATRGAEQHKLPTPINSRTSSGKVIGTFESKNTHSATKCSIGPDLRVGWQAAVAQDRQPEQHPAVQSFYISNNRPASYSVSPLPPCRIFSLLQAFSGGIPAIHVEHSAFAFFQTLVPYHI